MKPPAASIDPFSGHANPQLVTKQYKPNTNWTRPTQEEIDHPFKILYPEKEEEDRQEERIHNL